MGDEASTGVRWCTSLNARLRSQDFILRETENQRFKEREGGSKREGWMCREPFEEIFVFIKETGF